MLISVVVTSYNYQEYIKDTIKSVLSQTFMDWEMIVVDDASSDLSVEIIKEFAKNDNRIKLIVNETNLGLAKSLEKGVKAASGQWIAFLESDDLWTEDNLQKKSEIIAQNPDAVMIFNDVLLFGAEDKLKERVFEQSAEYLKKKTYPRNLFYDISLFNRILTFSTVLVNKEKLLQCGFNTPEDRILDWWLFLHLARHNDFYYIPEKLTKWRLHRDSYINKREKLYSFPVNISALTDILKKEKDLRIIPYIIAAIFNTLPRIKTRLIQLVKIRLGIPLKGEKS